MINQHFMISQPHNFVLFKSSGGIEYVPEHKLKEGHWRVIQRGNSTVTSVPLDTCFPIPLHSILNCITYPHGFPTSTFPTGTQYLHELELIHVITFGSPLMIDLPSLNSILSSMNPDNYFKQYDPFELLEMNANIIKLWKKNHRCCPMCGESGSDLKITDLEPNAWRVGTEYIDDVNVAQCAACNWTGKAQHLIADNNDAIYLDYDKAVNEWNKNHQHCPKCGGDHFNITLAAPIWVKGSPYSDIINNATCLNPECTWNGKVKDLLPTKTTQQ
jgi:ribosomal protein S27AE